MLGYIALFSKLLNLLIPRLTFTVFIFIIFAGAFWAKIIFNTNFLTALLISFGVVWIVFLNVNPYKLGSNKYTILENVPEQYLPREVMLADMDVYGAKYPVILKPVTCARTGFGIHVIHDVDEMNDIIQKIDVSSYMVQEYSSYDREVGILYENGRILSIVEKNGNEKVRKWCFHEEGCTHREDLVTPELEKVIADISCGIPNFNMGRFDIRFENDESFMKGQDFHILEINGTMGFDLRKDTEDHVGSVFIGHGWFWRRFLMGLGNIITLRGYDPLTLVMVMGTTMINTVSCKGDWEKMFALYT